MYPLTLHEITDRDDPAWHAWREIYEASFPVNERMSEVHFLGVLAEKAGGGAADEHLLVLRSDGADEPPIGIGYYEYDRELAVGFLWYLATQPGLRNQGHGSRFYAAICRQLAESGARMMVFEVEIPQRAGGEGGQESEWAQRRIDWYQRQGASLLNGIQYFQSVDTGVPPTEMWLMVHRFVPMDAERCYALCKEIFGDALTQTGTLALSGRESPG